jgi:hypothetical protein
MIMGSSDIQPQSRNPPTADNTKAMLKPGEQRLIEMARRVGYGSLSGIRVRSGELVLGSKVKTKRKHRLGKSDAGRCVRAAGEDFKLKQQHMDLIAKIRRVGDGVVTIEIQDGLPIDLVVEEELGI